MLRHYYYFYLLSALSFFFKYRHFCFINYKKESYQENSDVSNDPWKFTYNRRTIFATMCNIHQSSMFNTASHNAEVLRLAKQSCWKRAWNFYRCEIIYCHQEKASVNTCIAYQQTCWGMYNSYLHNYSKTFL